MPRPTTLFWVLVLLGLGPLFFRLPSNWEHPDQAFVAWDRRIIRIRLAEFSAIVVYLLDVYLVGWSFPLTPWPHTTPLAGLAVTLLGVIIAAWSKIRLGANFSTTLGVRREHQLITTGPYRLVRHPIYTGLLLVILGGALVYNTGAALVLLVLPFYGFFYWQSVVEEKLLAGHFGEAYTRYRATTGRLLPRLLR